MSSFPIPLNALRAIEIVMRTGALKPAADELGVTIGAVSQHIRRAEARLGVDLFERTPQGLRPTAQLLAAGPQLSGGFASLLEASRMLGRGDDNILTLTLGSVFAARWLVRRLPHFSAAHPHIELRLIATGRLIDLAHSDVDCAIRYGEGHWPGLVAEPLGCRRFRPVASPALAARLGGPEDLSGVPVIDDTATMLSWSGWFAAAGAAMPRLGGPRYSDPALAYEAAVTGQGVLLAVDRMSEDAVREGRLVRPFDVAAESAFDYWFVHGANRRIAPKIRLFHDWLLSEMGREALP